MIAVRLKAICLGFAQICSPRIGEYAQALNGGVVNAWVVRSSKKNTLYDDYPSYEAGSVFPHGSCPISFLLSEMQTFPSLFSQRYHVVFNRAKQSCRFASGWVSMSKTCLREVARPISKGCF